MLALRIIKMSPYLDAGIELIYSSFELTNYPQKSSEFVVGLSILDMIQSRLTSTAKYLQEGA